MKSRLLALSLALCAATASTRAEAICFDEFVIGSGRSELVDDQCVQFDDYLAESRAQKDADEKCGGEHSWGRRTSSFSYERSCDHSENSFLAVSTATATFQCCAAW